MCKNSSQPLDLQFNDSTQSQSVASDNSFSVDNRDINNKKHTIEITHTKMRRMSRMSVIAKKLEALKMQHFQIVAVSVLTLFTSLHLYNLLASHGDDPDISKSDISQTTNAMLHLGSFAANFGAQLWVTFVAGLTMFYSLPRHMFGKVQSRLFPMFFLWSLVCSALTLSTYLERHPYRTWDSTISTQVAILTFSFVTAAINSLVVSPAIVSAMLKTFQKEVEAGVGDVIGHTDAQELKKDPEYCKSYKMFRRCHGLSAMMVVTSLVCNTLYLYHLTQTTCIQL